MQSNKLYFSTFSVIILQPYVIHFNTKHGDVLGDSMQQDWQTIENAHHRLKEEKKNKLVHITTEN